MFYNNIKVLKVQGTNKTWNLNAYTGLLQELNEQNVLCLLFVMIYIVSKIGVSQAGLKNQSKNT